MVPVWVIFIALFGGILIGIIFSHLFKQKPSGYLRVDHSDPNEVYMFLELHESIEQVSNRKGVILIPKLEDFIPRK